MEVLFPNSSQSNRVLTSSRFVVIPLTTASPTTNRGDKARVNSMPTMRMMALTGVTGIGLQNLFPD